MEISPTGPQKPTYREEVTQSINLFEQGFQGMQQAKFDAQKEQYLKVMQESLKAIQDVANATVNKHLTDMKDKLSEDLNSYLVHPDDAHRKQIESDIHTIKES